MNDITALAQRMKQQATLANGFLYVETSNVLALVEALEKSQQHEQEWKSLCEAAAVDLDDWREIDDKSRGLICKLADAVIAKSERITSLESRTVTVKLPPRVDSSNVPFTAHTWNCCLDAVEKCLAAAGIQVIEGEG